MLGYFNKLTRLLPPQPLQRAKIRYELAQPLNLDYQDIYHPQGGANAKAQSDIIYIANSQALHAPNSTILEIGTGACLNLINTAKQFLDLHPERGILRYITIEKAPLSFFDIKKTLSAILPINQEPYQRLLTELQFALPPATCGFWPAQLAAGRIEITFIQAEAMQALQACKEVLRLDGKIDAIFLDSFCPSKNPECWRVDLLFALKQLLKSDGKLCSYTVAKSVIENLQKVGLVTDKKVNPSTQKKQSLIAYKPPQSQILTKPLPNIEIIGLGIAGAMCKRRFEQAGFKVSAYDAQRSFGASALPRALLHPRPHSNPTIFQGYLNQISWHLARGYYQSLNAFVPQTNTQGALWLEAKRNNDPTLERLQAGWNLWYGSDNPLMPSDLSGASLAAVNNDNFPASSIIVNNKKLINQLLGNDYQPSWPNFDLLPQNTIRIIAAGPWCRILTENLPLHTTGGQIDLVELQTDTPGLELPIFGDGYSMPYAYAHPTQQNARLQIVGSDYKHELSDDPLVADKHSSEKNIARLHLLRPGQTNIRSITARSKLRVSAPGRIPLLCSVSDRTLVIAGLGSRGFSYAPLLARVLAHWVETCYSEWM